MAEKPSGSSSAGRRRLFQWVFLVGTFLVVAVLFFHSPTGRGFGVRCAGKLGAPSVPFLSRALWDESFDVQAAAREELARLGEKAVPPLVKSLRDPEKQARRQALQALSALGSSGHAAAPAVIALFNEKDTELRTHALLTLAAIGGNDPAVTAVVIHAMSDPEASVRVLAVNSLWMINAASEAAFPALTNALKDPDSEVRFQATVAFAKLKMRTAPALAALEATAADDADPKVREEANEMLARLKRVPQSKSAAPASAATSADVAFSGEMTQAEVAVQVGKISVATLRRYVTAFGTVEPEPGTAGQAPASAKVTSPLAGLVAEVNCVEGQQVEKGQVLFTLDSRKLDAQTGQARAVLAAAEKSFDEQEKISKPDAAAQLLFAKARQERDLARSDLEFALAQQALLKVAAPCSGTVLRVNVRPGEVEDPESSAALVEVADLKRLIVSANVPASDLPSVNTNQAVEILPPQNADSPPNVVTGRVALVEDRVDTKTDMGTVDISVPASAHLRPGQFVRVRIVAEEHRDCLAVPSQSLVKNEGGEWVICLVRGKLAGQQPVVPGLRDGGLVEVRSPAIKAGDMVVTAGAAALPQKTAIRILKD
jgi:membrane fusion protein (multidrug efflux system)